MFENIYDFKKCILFLRLEIATYEENHRLEEKNEL